MRRFTLSLISLSAFLCASCTHQQTPASTEPVVDARPPIVVRDKAAKEALDLQYDQEMKARGSGAKAVLKGKSGVAIGGTVYFTDLPDGVLGIRVALRNISPGLHGFHIHETGDCLAFDASTAGPHFNPNGGAHGALHDATRHAGDLGNVEPDANGEINLELRTRGLTAAPGPKSVIGRAIIIHADPDDGKTQPAGNSGKRIGCGIIYPLSHWTEPNKPE